jgi:KRAB domain-containing zinc finger protein
VDSDEYSDVTQPVKLDEQGSNERVVSGQATTQDISAKTEAEDEGDWRNPESNAKMCPVCRVRTTDLGCSYSQHLREAHPGVPRISAILVHPRVCPHCPFRTNHESFFQIHLRTHGLGKYVDYNHQCSDCEAKFYRLAELVLHVEEKHGVEKLHACPECGQKFTETSSLETHKKRKHAVKLELTEKCEYCGEAFDWQHKARCERAKMLIPTITETHVCPECSEPFSSGQDVQSHVASVHNDEGSEGFKFVCQDCGGKYEKKFELCSHAYKAHGKKFRGCPPFNCPHCYEVSFFAVGYADHIAKHNGGVDNKPREKMCPECGIPASDVNNFGEHFKNVHPDSNKEPVSVLVQPLVCPHCPYFSGNEDKYKSHLAKHSSGKRYSCTNCDACFVMNSELENHLHEVHGKELKMNPVGPNGDATQADEKYKCSRCDAKFRLYSALREHLNEFHKSRKLAKKKHICSKCDSKFYTFLELREHSRKVHGEDTQFPCPSCEAKFKNRKYLRVHMMRKHTGASTVCDECGETVNDAWQLYLHQQKVHTNREPMPGPEPDVLESLETEGGEVANTDPEAKVTDKAVGVEKPPRYCDDCGKMYKTRDLLLGHAYSVHGRTLPGLKKYTCPVCDKLFHCKVPWRAHFRRVCSKVATPEQNVQFIEILKKKIVRIVAAKVPKMKKVGKGKEPEVTVKEIVKDKAAEVPKKKVVKDKTAEVPKENVETSVGDVPVENLGGKVVEVTPENVKDRTAEGLNKKGKPRKCPLCCIIMSNLAYTGHFKIAHPDVPYQPAICLYPCPKCYTLCKSQDKLDNHLTKKHGGEKKYPCDECGEKFAYKSALFGHVRNRHTEEACVCEECGATFDRKYKLTSHKTRKHPRGPTPTYSCPECDVTYTTREGLARHNKVAHGVGKISTIQRLCEDCGKKFVFQDHLCAHAYKKHGKTLPGLKMFPCHACDKVYHVKAHFEGHLKTHESVTN